jgi:hypothetical protein
MSDLRAAVMYLTSLRCDWSDRECAELGKSELPATRAYLARLGRLQVIEFVEQGRWIVGPKAEGWRKQKVKTRPGGNAKEYLRVKGLREELAQRDWLVSTGRAVRRVGVLTSQGESISYNEVQPVSEPAEREGLMKSMLTYAEAAHVLDVSMATIKRWARSEQLHVTRITAQIVRISPVEIERITHGDIPAEKAARKAQDFKDQAAERNKAAAKTG